MKDLIWAEFKKMHRLKIIWIAVFTIFLIIFIVFAQGQFSYGDVKYIENPYWYLTAVQSLGTLFVLPAIITLFGSYTICREDRFDTLKHLRMIPVDEPKMVLSKLFVTCVFGVSVSLVLFILALGVEVLLHASGLTASGIFEYFAMYLVTGIGVVFAVAPIITIVAVIKKGYWISLILAEVYSFAAMFFRGLMSDFHPITATFNLSGYYKTAVSDKMISCAVLIMCCLISYAILCRKPVKI
jgi:ABC-type transport system involved in multi-copper enzyme maturation permease subunit